MSAAPVQALYDAMKSMDMAALASAFADDVVAIEPSSLPYGGTTTTREALFENVFAYLLQRGEFRLETSEVFGDGDRVAGHFTATLTAHGSGESVSVDQTELYDVANGVISKVEVFQRDTPVLIDFFERNGPAS